MREISMTDMLGEVESHPLGDFRLYLKHVSDDDMTNILRFDNGFGALIRYPNTVTPIAWRRDSKSVQDFYDAGETLYIESYDFSAPLTKISTWGPPTPF